MNLFPRALARASALLATLLLFFSGTAFGGGPTITVNDAGDTTNPCATTGAGTCTLRDALTYANAHAGSTIAFDIAGGGVQTITPQTIYPAITAPVTIDGFTQPGSSANTNGPGLPDNSVHLIEVSGAALMTDGLVLGAGSDGSVIRGLVLNHWYSRDITLSSDFNTIAGNFVGTDPTGTTGQPGNPSNVGIFVFAPTASAARRPRTAISSRVTRAPASPSTLRPASRSRATSSAPTRAAPSPSPTASALPRRPAAISSEGRRAARAT